MRVLIFGGSGLVGSKFIGLHSQTYEIKAPQLKDVDILDSSKVSKVIEEFNPDSVINFAAFTQVEEAETQKDNKEGICFQINALGAKNVAERCKKANKRLIHISTEYVFDGTKSESPYIEDDKPNPINWYGQTKFFGEGYVLESGCKSTIVRLSMPYSYFYEVKSDVARFFLNQLRLGSSIKAIEDQRITPTLVDDIAIALKTLIESNVGGVYHVSSKDSVTPLEFAKTIAEEFRLDYSLISAISLEEYNKKKLAKLLKYSWLNPAKFEREFGDQVLHTVEESLISFKEAVDAKVHN